MKTVTVSEAKAQMSRLIREVVGGEEVAIAPYRKAAVVKLVKVDAEDLRLAAALQSDSDRHDR